MEMDWDDLDIPHFDIPMFTDLSLALIKHVFAK
jgi:hypothetical protein